MATCTSCGVSGQPDTAHFCYSCGSNLRAPTCASCGAEVMPGARFCGTCGAEQGAQAPSRPAPLTAAPVASRRITSVLFGDLVGFTTLSESRDQEDVRELLSRYFDECRQIIARYGGTVEKFIGDAVMAVWGVPVAHEDDAERSVRAGLELVNRVADLGADVGVPDLAMRVGIVTGEVAVTVGAQQQGMVAGDAVNTAARVQSAAEPGQVWVDETTRLLTSSAISYVDVGSHVMKGKADPVPLWSVRAVVAAVGGVQRADGLEAPLVGRDRELRLVKELFHSCEETRHPTLLVVDGEPGVGKSRLGWEFEKYVDGLSSAVRWHSGRCLSYGEGVAFFALAEAVRTRLQTLRADEESEEDDPGRLLELGLERYVAEAEEREWLRPRLGALLGIGAVAAFPREDLFSAWATFLERVGEGQHPVVLVIDDAQHADDGLLNFLDYLLAVASFPCFVTLFTRPGLLEANPSLATNRRATVLHLEMLSDRDMGALVDGLVVGLPTTVRDSLVARAEGIPLFAVETVRSLIDRDLVVPRGGQYVLADDAPLDLDSMGAPASLQALINARLDTLPPDQRRVVDQASVVGGSFTRDLIAALCPEVADIDVALAALVRLQLLRQESNRFSNEHGLFQFVQSAVRQVAYGTLSRRDRKACHLAVVGLLQADAEDSDELSSILAQHYLAAIDAVPDDDHVEALTEAAIEHLRRAAARTAALGAPAEAAGHLSTACDRCREPRLRARIQVDLAEQLVRTGSFADARRHAEAARDALDELGEEDLAARAVGMLGLSLATNGDYEAADAVVSERLLRVQGRIGLEAELALVRPVVAARLRMGADYRDLAEHSIRLAERLGSPRETANGYVGLATHYMTRGPHGLGRMLLESAADIARECHDTVILCRALGNLNADWTQDDAQRAAAFGREAIVVARATGDQLWTSNARVNLSMALAVLGEWDEVLATADEEGMLPGDASIVDVVRGRIMRARGERWRPRGDLPREAFDEDSTVTAFRALGGVLEQLGEGGVPDFAAVLDGLEEMRAASGVFDDFTTAWQLAADLAWEAGEHTVVERLLSPLAAERDKLPVGLDAQSRRVRALLALERGESAETVEDHFCAAIALAESWHSAPAIGRCCADLGVWLTHERRAGEAAPLLERSRAVFADLGAVTWQRELDEQLAGTRS